MDNNNNNALLIAGSIVAAGALIAVGIYLAPANTTQNENSNDQQAQDKDLIQRTSIDNRPVTEEDFIRGSSTAAVTVIDYSDLECPFCKQFHQIMNDMTDKYSGQELAWVYRHFPLESIHSKAPKEAHATECAAELGGEDAFWQYTDRIFAVTPSNNEFDLDRLPEIAAEIGLDRQAFVSCQESGRNQSKVQEDFEDARSTGGSGTPFVIIKLNEKPDTETVQLMEKIARSANKQSRRVRVKIDENNTKLSSNGALPARALDRLIQTVTDQTNSTTTAAASIESES